MSGIVGGNLGRGSGLIKAGAIDDNSVTLAKMAGLARGKLIYGDTSGDPAALAAGGADEVLTHDGTDFDWAAAAGGGDLSFGGDTFGADKTIGSNDTYALSFETDGNEAMKIDTAGIITKPLQPACMFQLDQTDTNTTGDGTTVTVGGTDGGFTEIFDVNADLGATASFTAPVTGYYQVSGSISLRSLGADHDDLQVHCVASNRTYTVRIKPADIADAYAASVVFPYSCLLDMDANDTVYLTYRVRGGTKVVDPGDEGKHTIYLV